MATRDKAQLHNVLAEKVLVHYEVVTQCIFIYNVWMYSYCDVSYVLTMRKDGAFS